MNRRTFIKRLIIVGVLLAISLSIYLRPLQAPEQTLFSLNTVEIVRADDGYIYIRYSTRTTMERNGLSLYINGEKHGDCSQTRNAPGTMIVDCLVESGLSVGDIPDSKLHIVFMLNGTG